MMTQPTLFRHTTNVKLSQISKTLVNCVFPNVEDLIASSKSFDILEGAIKSATDLVTEITTSLNMSIGEDRYGIVSELNPSHSKQETISKDWAENEIAKIWVIDKIHRNQNPGPIKAVGLTQILEFKGDPVPLN